MSCIKRENNSIVLSSNNIVLDIEGTTTSITFVKDVLFPYVRKHLESYVKENWDSECFQAIVNALRIQANEDKEKKLEGVVEIPEDGEKDVLAKAVIENVLWQMDLDIKAKGLKDLQGLIMEVGYKKGEIKGHVYEDVQPNLKLWTELGKSVYIYSSGSVHAQKLLYGHSEKGDLLPHIKGHFDTTVGMKGDADSYKKILEEISSSPSETVFFTDIPKEARAAKEAGLLAILLSREGNAPLTEEDKTEFQVITSFSEIQFENNSKKRKVCTNDEKKDNKSVESCEVSLKPQKEPTNSTLTQQNDVAMEVEESSTEEVVCKIEKSNEVLQNENSESKPQLQNIVTENGDVEMKTTNDTAEEIENLKDNEAIESQTNEGLNNGDAVPKLSDDLKIENNENKKVKDEDNLDSSIDKKEIENPVDETNAANKESQPCEKETNLEVNPDGQKPTHDNIPEKSEKITQDERDNENSQIPQQNGDLAHNSSDVTENKSESNNVIQNKSDTEVVMEKSSEKQNNEESLNHNGNVEENGQSKPELSNKLDLHTNENGKIDEKKSLETSQMSTNVNDTVSSSTEENASNNNMEVDEKQSANMESTISDSSTSNVTSSQDIQSVDTDIDRPNQETPPAHVGTVSGSSGSTLTMDCNKVAEIKEVSQVKTKVEDISDNIKSNENKSEELCSEPNKETGIEIRATETNVDTKLSSCIDETSEKSTVETTVEQQNVEVSRTDQAQSDKMETDEVNNLSSKDNIEDESANQSSSKSEKEIKLDDSVSALTKDVDVEMKAVSTLSAETENQPENRQQDCAEQSDSVKSETVTDLPQNTDEKVKKCDDEKTEIPEPSQNTDEKATKCDDEKTETPEPSQNNDEKAMECDDEKAEIPERSQNTEEKSSKCDEVKAEIPEISQNTVEKSTKCDEVKAEIPELPQNTEEKSTKCDEVKAEIPETSENTVEKLTTCDDEKAETSEPSQNTDEKTTKEPISDLSTKESDAIDVKNEVNKVDSNNLDEKEPKKSLNGELNGDAKSVECSDDKEVKHEGNETAVKKCDVSENSTITAIVEA